MEQYKEEMRLYTIIGIVCLLCVYGCGKNSSLLGKTSISPSDIGLFDMFRGGVSSNTVSMTSEFNAVNNSTATVTVPVNVNVLEKYNSPIVSIAKFVAYESKTFPKNSIYRKITEYSKDGKIIKESEFVYPDKR